MLCSYDLLRGGSQHTHRKLRDVAADVTETGTLDVPATRGRAVTAVQRPAAS